MAQRKLTVICLLLSAKNEVLFSCLDQLNTSLISGHLEQKTKQTHMGKVLFTQRQRKEFMANNLYF